MVRRQLQRISLGSLFLIIGAISIFAQPKIMVSGKVISKEKQEVVDFATVYLKGTTYGCTTNEEGIYHLHAPAGKYTLVVSAIGYET
ncbi:carboxypeptidase-like regulatory domain-containing protein, partial [uncultured Bacteroides sp.]